MKSPAYGSNNLSYDHSKSSFSNVLEAFTLADLTWNSIKMKEKEIECERAHLVLVFQWNQASIDEDDIKWFYT